MFRRAAVPLTLTILALAPVASAGPASDVRIPLPDGWQPEGIASGPGKSLYVGSIPTGAILKLNPKTKETETVVTARQGFAAIGLDVDRKRLLVAGGATGKAFAYDRKTGAELEAFQLADGEEGETFVNDVTLAKRFAYFTDSRRAVLYKVRRDLSGSATLPLPDVTLETGNNLNGIEATRKGRHLLAVQSNTGALWRIDPKTGGAVKVDLGGATLVNGDGLLLEGRRLLVVQNRVNKIAVVKLAKGFGSGKVKRTFTSEEFDVPTTIARSGKRLYAVNARFGTTDEQPAPYWVTKLRRKP